jgi:putative selenium metabolism protein SsnA
MNENILIKNATLLYDNNKILDNYAVFIEDEIIKEVGASQILENKHKNNNIKLIDAEHKLVLSGFINAHMHFYSTFARGILLNSPPANNFVDILQNLWWRLDKKITEDDIYYSAMIPMISAIKNGTTTLIDHHASPYAIEGSLDSIYRAFQDTGLRGSTCYEVSDRDGKDICKKGIDENLRFIEKHNNTKDDNVKGLFGLHSAFTLGDDTLKYIQDCNIKCGFHIHTSEAIDDNQYNLDKYGLTPVKRLNKFGITGNKSIFAHCNHLTDDDILIMKETKTIVVHNPQSNMNNAVGTADIIRYLGEGITVGLGTDGMSAGMMDSINFASLIHKYNKHNPNIGFNESYIIAMNNNSEIASKVLGYDVGKIKEGYKADCIIIDYIPPTPMSDSNFWGHFLFGIIPSGRVETTIVNGKILMEKYQIKNINEQNICEKARTLAKKLWERF